MITLFQTIRHAHHFVWYSVFQPSKAYNLIKENERNSYIFMLAFFLFGLLCGGILAIPHYYLYGNFMRSLCFAIAAALGIAFTVAFAAAFAETLTEAVNLISAFTAKGGVASVFLFVISGGLALGVSGALATAIEFQYIKDFEIILLPLCFLTCCLFSFSFIFACRNREIKDSLEKKKEEKSIISHQKFQRIHEGTLIWFWLTALLLGLALYADINQAEINTKALIVILSLFIIPIFILRIPDYLLCLPIWFFQYRKAKRQSENSHQLEIIYNNSILFKNEMILLPLPRLPAFISLFAKNSELGIEQALEKIHYIYWFTFQQKQAQKAIIMLGNDKETAHRYIHFLLEKGNLSLLRTLSEKNRLAGLYLRLFDNIADIRHENNILCLSEEDENRNALKKKEQDCSESLDKKLSAVCEEMKKNEGYKLNEEIAGTLCAGHQFLVSENLRDFYEACSTSMDNLSDDIKYLRNIKELFSGIKKIKDKLKTIESVQKFESRRYRLSEQKQAIEALSKQLSFYEPFATLWIKVLEHSANLIEQEIQIQQSSAEISIKPINKEIRASAEERKLYFQISNTGQKVASDISITIESDNPGLSFCGDRKIRIENIEAGNAQEVFFPVKAVSPITASVSGKIIFSDRARENKEIPFSFSITVIKEVAVFHKIENPYIAGPALRRDTDLFFGRQDAFDFINENIVTKEGHHTLVCYGLRRSGKSSLLYRIENKGFSDNRLIPVYFDMQGVDDEKHFYKRVSESIVERMKYPNRDYPKGFGEFKDWLNTTIRAALGEKILVLMIDEFEEIQQKVEDRKIPKGIFANIRHLMQHEEKLIFLFCGTHQLEEMSADYWSIFFNTAIYYKISYLSLKDTRDLIRKPVEGQMSYDDLAVDQILKMTHGQPFLTQMICRGIVNLLNEKRKNYATINDVDDVVDKIISQGGEHFSEHIWQHSDRLGRLILSSAADELIHRHLEAISFDALYDKVSAISRKFSRKDCLGVANKFVSKDILSEKNMNYSFVMGLFKKWVGLRHPLPQVREEI